MNEVQRLRLFVAVDVPPGHLHAVDEAIAPVRERMTNARWAPVESQHVTLKFLGSTPGDRLEEVQKVCARAARSHAQGRARLTDLGAFPKPTRIRVLWVGLEDDGLLARIAKDLDRGFEPLGFAAEARDYTPHLTLARFKLPIPLKSGMPELHLSHLDEFPLDRIVLFRSHLSPKGARYERLEEFDLGPGR